MEVVPRLVREGITVDAIVTDPPYGLEFMGKEWDKFGGSPRMSGTELADHMRDENSPGPWGRRKRPIAPNDYGLRNEKCIKCGKWRISSSRCQCAEPEYVSRRRRDASQAVLAYQEFSEVWTLKAWDILKPGGYLLAFGGARTHHRLWCAIEDAGFVIQDTIMWLYGSGFPKGRAQLKPAFEPICVAYKPGGKRQLQIDECRIPIDESVDDRDWATNYAARNVYAGGFTGNRIASSPQGRWPANVVHDGSNKVMTMFPYSAGQQGDIRGSEPSATGDNGIYGHFDRMAFDSRGDTGSAARFFYCAKADDTDRWGSKHPTVKPVDLIKWLVRLVTPKDGAVLDCFAGSGTTGVAALATGRRAILIEREAKYISDIRERLAFYEGEGRHSVVSKNRRGRETTGSLL